MKRNLLLEYRVRKLEKLLLEKATGTLPKYFYHGTMKKYADNILKNGIKRHAANVNHSLTNPNCVYFTRTLKSAKDWAATGSSRNGEPVVVFRIDSSYLDPEKLSRDANDAGLEWEDEHWATPDDEIPDWYFDIDFDRDNDSPDFEYSGDIPASAIELVWESDDNINSKVQDAFKKNTIAAIIDNWEYIKDAEVPGGGSVMNGALRASYRMGDLIKSPKELLNIPAEILNHIIPESWRENTVLTNIISNNLAFDNVMDTTNVVSRIRGLSDYNIESFFKNFLTKPKQKIYLDQMTELPIDFLMRAKPYITKKYWSQLGI
jgi:hypothetical protein